MPRKTPATQTRYTPDQQARSREEHIQEADVLAVIDARGGQAYAASVETGLANRWPFSEASDRRRAIDRALATGTVVRTPMGTLRRRPDDDA